MKTLACSYDRVASYSFTLFFITMFVTIPLCMVVFSNMNIYITVVKSRKRVTSHNQEAASNTITVSETVNGQDDSVSGRSNFLKVPHISSLSNKTTKVTDIASKTNSANITEQTKQQSKKGREKVHEIKLAKTLFLVFIAFCLCWTPYGVLVLVDVHNKAQKAVYLFAILMAHTSSTLNFLIYGITNQRFRQGYKYFLQRIVGRCV